MLKVTEIEYSELLNYCTIYRTFKNYKVTLRIQTTPETYEEDYAELVIEVKKKLAYFLDIELKKEKELIAKREAESAEKEKIREEKERLKQEKKEKYELEQRNKKIIEKNKKELKGNKRY